MAGDPAAGERIGIPAENMFRIWDWVGGRTSLCSAVGLSLLVALGDESFRALLDGSHAMDDHFATAALGGNLPVICGLLAVWYRNFMGAETTAVVPYSDALRLFPAYLQQLWMESNGKSVTAEGGAAEVESGSVLWGGPGTNAQHAFFQLLHQGTVLVPVDLIGFARSAEESAERHDLLAANLLAQAEALAFGRTADELEDAGVPEQTIAHRVMPGNRPSSVLLAERLTPATLGALVALYEHSVFTQAAIWGINPFDQWGVELGKELASRIAPELARRLEARAAPRLVHQCADPPLPGLAGWPVARPRWSCAVPRTRFERSKRGCASTGSSRRAGRSSRQTSISATGSRRRIRRTRQPPPPEPCPSLPLAACAIRADRNAAGSRQRRASSRRPTGRETGARTSIGRPSRRCELRSHAATSTRSTSSSISRRRSRARPAALAAALASLSPLHPDPLIGERWAIVSASPELFLARRGRHVWTKPIKGTRPLGAAAELGESAKDAAEHVMIVDLERNDLSRVCEPGTVRWPELLQTRRLAGVEHMVSTVEGTLREGVGLAEILEATFPGGSVTGAPKIAAVDLIAELEPVGRGASMGALGRVLRKRRLRSRADDPNVRDRRGTYSPLGRRWSGLGLGSGSGGGGVVDEGAAPPRGDRIQRRSLAGMRR